MTQNEHNGLHPTKTKRLGVGLSRIKIRTELKPKLRQNRNNII